MRLKEILEFNYFEVENKNCEKSNKRLFLLSVVLRYFQDFHFHSKSKNSKKSINRFNQHPEKINKKALIFLSKSVLNLFDGEIR